MIGRAGLLGVVMNLAAATPADSLSAQAAVGFGAGPTITRSRQAIEDVGALETRVSAKVRSTFGGFVDWNLGGRWQVRSGIRIVGKGHEEVFFNPDNPGLESFPRFLRMTQLEVFGAARFGIPIGRAMDAYLLVGPFASRETACDLAFEGVDLPSECTFGVAPGIDADLTEALDFGMIFGSGVDFRLLRRDLFFQVDYALGVADINRLPIRRTRTRVISILVGSKFSLGN